MTNDAAKTAQPELSVILFGQCGGGGGGFHLSEFAMLFGMVVLVLIIWIGVRLYLDSAITRRMFGWHMLADPRGTCLARSTARSIHFRNARQLTAGARHRSARGIGAALFLTEAAPPWLAGPVSFIIELLARFPASSTGSGLLVMCPGCRSTSAPGYRALRVDPHLCRALLPDQHVRRGHDSGDHDAAVHHIRHREVIKTVPPAQREAALGLGATRWETIRDVVSSQAGRASRGRSSWRWAARLANHGRGHGNRQHPPDQSLALPARVHDAGTSRQPVQRGVWRRTSSFPPCWRLRSFCS